MIVLFNLPARKRPLLRALEFLVDLNRDAIRTAGGRIPPLYKAGVRYEREGRTIAGRPKEHWRLVPQVLKHGAGDCEDLASWRIAELRERGINAAPYLRRHKNMFHVLVRHPDGTLEDPSKVRGMKGKA